MPRTEEQFEKIRIEKRQLIMDSALELFAENGFQNTSISDIAKHADISKGLLYNYFTSKEELLESILNEGIDEMYQLFDVNKDGKLEREEMELFITETFRIIRSNLRFWKLYWAVSLHPQAIKYFEKRRTGQNASMINMGVEYFRQQGFENPFLELLLFSATIKGIALVYTMSPEGYPIDEAIQEVIHRYCKK
ncbi:MAG TPA: TetR/AcrR family transcriptional regulator [Bacteroidales bacterium]|nr:TetR/AcrR family transcriptional regulator [Bacteroidales bacterium]